MNITPLKSLVDDGTIEDLTLSELEKASFDADVAYEGLCEEQDAYLKHHKAEILTDAISELVTIPENPDPETKQKLTRLTNAISQTFGGLDGVLYEEETAGNEFLPAVISILTSTTFTVISVIAGAIITAFDSLRIFEDLMSGSHGDPIKETISFKGVSKVGIDGKVEVGSGLEHIEDFFSSYSDLAKPLVDVVLYKSIGDMKKFQEAVDDLAKEMTLRLQPTTTRFGKGLSVYASETLPGDKRIYLKFDSLNMPITFMADAEEKNPKYDAEIKAPTKNQVKNLNKVLVKTARSVVRSFNKKEAEKVEKDFARGLDKALKDALDDAEEAKQEATVKAFKKEGAKASRVYKVYPDMAKYLKKLNKAYVSYAKKAMSNLEIIAE